MGGRKVSGLGGCCALKKRAPREPAPWILVTMGSVEKNSGIFSQVSTWEKVSLCVHKLCLGDPGIRETYTAQWRNGVHS